MRVMILKKDGTWKKNSNGSGGLPRQLQLVPEPLQAGRILPEIMRKQ